MDRASPTGSRRRDGADRARRASLPALVAVTIVAAIAADHMVAGPESTGHRDGPSTGDALDDAAPRPSPAPRTDTDEGRSLTPDARVDEVAAPANDTADSDVDRQRPPDPDAPVEAALAEQAPVVDPIVEVAERKELEPELLVSLAWHESRFDPAAASTAGAVGVLQVMPVTLEHMAERLDRSLDPLDPRDNALAGAAYLDRLVDAHADVEEALIAYNQGPTALAEHGAYPAAKEFATDVLATRDQLREVAW